MPEVSICIPTYNCAEYLPAALNSVLRQGLTDYELIVVDNASTDDTEELIRSVRIPQLRYFRNATNVGSRENGNRCLAKATGEYVHFLCADDVLLDDVMSEQLQIMRGHRDVVLVACNLIETDEHLSPTGRREFIPGFHRGAFVIEACLTGMMNGIGGPSSVMIRRSALKGLAVDASFNLLSDLRLYLQILQRGNYANIDRDGYLYRRHSGSDTNVNCPPGSHVAEFSRLVEEFGSWNPVNSYKAMRMLKHAHLEVPLGRWMEAFLPHHVVQAARCLPLVVRKGYGDSRSLTLS